MYINKIIKLKDNKYKIEIDGNYIITYDNVILENDLLYKKSIDSKLYKRIIDDTKYYDTYNKIVKYIMKRKRSEKEVREYLLKQNINEFDSEKIINKLKSINLINDIEFCKSYINDKLYLSKCGINKIKTDLLLNDIPLDIINDCLNNVDCTLVNERLKGIIIKKINSNKKYSKEYLRKKILNDMINLGYDREEILLIINENLCSDDSILNKDFEKIYNKLSKKYSGYELKNKVINRLLSKGFTYDDINSLIEKTEV